MWPVFTLYIITQVLTDPSWCFYLSEFWNVSLNFHFLKMSLSNDSKSIHVFSPLCTILWCSFNVPICEKHFGHWLQENGFSPVWILRCLSKWLFCLKAFGQRLQGYGFSSVCIQIYSNVFSNEYSNSFFQKTPLGNDCKRMVFHLCEF